MLSDGADVVFGMCIIDLSCDALAVVDIQTSAALVVARYMSTQHLVLFEISKGKIRSYPRRQIKPTLRLTYTRTGTGNKNWNRIKFPCAATRGNEPSSRPDDQNTN